MVGGVLEQLKGHEIVEVGPVGFKQCDVKDAVVVALGKKMAELAFGGTLGNYNDEAGNEYLCKDAAGNEAMLVLQYHPAYVEQMMLKKGGASEKSMALWYDIWDTVQMRLLGLDEEPPEVAMLAKADEIVPLLEHLATSPSVLRTAYDYETWGDITALRPELNRTFRILTIGVAWREECKWCCGCGAEDGTLHVMCEHCQGEGSVAIGAAFPLDRDQGPVAQKKIEEAWLKIVDKGSTAHHAQYEHKCNRVRFGRSGPLRDTMLMDNALDELQKHKLERVMIRCGVAWAGYKRASKAIQVNPAGTELFELLRYNGLDALGTLLCDEALQAKLDDEGLDGVARGDELFTENLARLELAGMRSDLSAAAGYRKKAKVELGELQTSFMKLPEVQRVERWAEKNIKSCKKGAVFNPKSPPMMRRLIINELRVPIKPNKEGKYKLDKKALEAYDRSHPVLTQLNRVRSVAAMGGFLDLWETFIGPDGNIHSQYRLAQVVTGRLSSSDPPQQNMPRKSDIRRAIISRFRNGLLVEGDVVQQEPRILAGWSQDVRMLDAINSGQDLHGYVASLIFEVPYEGKETKYRDEFGKRMNLGIMYGQTEWGLAAKTGITVERAKSLLDDYDRLFTGIREWREMKHRQAMSLGYVTDLFGARRHLPGAQNSDDWVMKRALRQAANFPIQSTANRFTLFSLCVLYTLIESEGLQDQIVPCGTVHDSIIADAAPGYEHKAGEMLEAALTWHNEQDHWKDSGVRMEAEIKVGANLKDTGPLVELAA